MDKGMKNVGKHAKLYDFPFKHCTFSCQPACNQKRRRRCMLNLLISVLDDMAMEASLVPTSRQHINPAETALTNRRKHAGGPYRPAEAVHPVKQWQGLAMNYCLDWAPAEARCGKNSYHSHRNLALDGNCRTLASLPGR